MHAPPAILVHNGTPEDLGTVYSKENHGCDQPSPEDPASCGGVHISKHRESSRRLQLLILRGDGGTMKEVAASNEEAHQAPRNKQGPTILQRRKCIVTFPLSTRTPAMVCDRDCSFVGCKQGAGDPLSPQPPNSAPIISIESINRKSFAVLIA